MLFRFSSLDSPRRSTYSGATLLHRDVQADDMSVVTILQLTDPVGDWLVYITQSSLNPSSLLCAYSWQGVQGFESLNCDTEKRLLSHRYTHRFFNFMVGVGV